MRQNGLSKLTVSLIITTVLAGALFISFENAYSVETTCDFQHRECYTKKGYPACYHKLDIEKYYQFLNEGNTEFADQILSDGNKCFTLKGNEKAFMLGKGSGYVKFGIRGQDKTFWSLREALVSRQ
jgi:hypothetical protein